MIESILKEKKWTNGEKCERSYKNQKPIINNNNEIIDNVLHYKINSMKKNEYYNEKLQERELISHTYKNPFLKKNFLDVLDDQTNFLIPKNSNNLED